MDFNLVVTSFNYVESWGIREILYFLFVRFPSLLNRNVMLYTLPKTVNWFAYNYYMLNFYQNVRNL